MFNADGEFSLSLNIKLSHKLDVNHSPITLELYPGFAATAVVPLINS